MCTCCLPRLQGLRRRRDRLRDPPLQSPGRRLSQASRRVPSPAGRAAPAPGDPGAGRDDHQAGGEKRGVLTMVKRSPPCWRPDDASERKTFKSALCHLLQTEFPGIFGPTITRNFVDKIDELYDRFRPPASRFKVGQILWAAVAIDDPPRRNKRIEDTELVPIVLDLVTAQDIQETGATGWLVKTRLNKIIRLCRQAHEQKAVLSLADVSLLLHVHNSQYLMTL